MWHLNAKLTYLSRPDLVHQVEAAWSRSEVARQFRESRPTVSKHVHRHAESGAARAPTPYALQTGSSLQLFI